MLLRKAEAIPGGRLAVFLAPLVLLALGAMVLSANELIQVDNSVILALAIGVLWQWRQAFPIFLSERKKAGAIWLSLGVVVIVAVTVVSVFLSWFFRVFHEPEMAVLILTNSYATAAIRFGYAFGFGCLYVVPQAVDDTVPPHGWISLFAIVAASALIAIAGIMLTK